jgi:hypothetical protein
LEIAQPFPEVVKYLLDHGVSISYKREDVVFYILSRFLYIHKDMDQYDQLSQSLDLLLDAALKSEERPIDEWSIDRYAELPNEFTPVQQNKIKQLAEKWGSDDTEVVDFTDTIPRG